MAQKLDAMPKRRGRATVHPWGEWSDGSVWVITQGEDFYGALESMRTQLYGRARDMDKTVELVIDKEKSTITFTMKPKPAED